jgi:hypothetical protein
MSQSRSPWDPWRRVRDAVLRDPASPWTPTQRLVAVVIGDCLDESGTARPSVRLIMSRTGLARSTVQRHLAALTHPTRGIFYEETGGSTPDGGRWTSVYTLRTGPTVGQVPARGRGGSDRPHSGTGPTVGVDRPHSRAVKDSMKDSSPDASRRAAARRVRKGSRKESGNVRHPEDGWPAAWAHLLAKAWTEESGGVIGHRHIGGVVKRLQDKYPFPVVERGLRDWLRAGNARFKPATFVRDAGQWCNGNESPPLRPEPTGPEFCGPRSLG